MRERELSDEAVSHQVDQLEAYVDRGGAVAVWLLSKDFCRADEAALLAELQRRKGIAG